MPTTTLATSHAAPVHVPAPAERWLASNPAPAVQQAAYRPRHARPEPVTLEVPAPV